MIKNFHLSKQNLPNFISKVTALVETGDYVANVTERTKNRTELQNRISHSWYNELANELKADTALGYKCFCKLHFGIGILRSEDDEFRKVYDTAIKGLSYEQKLQVMKILPVTSIMTTKQLSQYLEAVKEHFLIHEGFDLKFPADYLNES